LRALAYSSPSAVAHSDPVQDSGSRNRQSDPLLLQKEVVLTVSWRKRVS
jgi:hypothetical protein